MPRGMRTAFVSAVRDSKERTAFLSVECDSGEEKA